MLQILPLPLTLAMPFSSPALKLIQSYSLSQKLTLHILQGSVIEFGCKTGAIVNAANEGCLGGGAVDGAITDAGGDALADDRLALPRIESSSSGQRVRCPTGSAVVTGPNTYGSLQTPFIIHAVGPNYWDFADEETEYANSLLQSAYQSSLDRAEENNLTDIAFALLSAGIFRGPDMSLRDILRQSVTAIQQWPLQPKSLEHIYLCAFTEKECDTLEEVCDDLLGSPMESS
jgi:O-acetyl-ADP-ribose deacetylase (regulator of RNase III)